MKPEVVIVPYHPWHFFLLNSPTQITLLKEHNLSALQIARFYDRGPGFTGIVNGEPIAAGGIMRLWGQVGEAWIIATPLVKKYPLVFHKLVKMFLHDIIKNCHFVRVQACVEKDSKQALKWIEALGFKLEGEMPRYFAGKTFIRYALIPEEEPEEEICKQSQW